MKQKGSRLFGIMVVVAVIVLLAGCNLFSRPKDTFDNVSIQPNNTGRVESGDTDRLDETSEDLSFVAKGDVAPKGAKVVAQEPPTPEGYTIVAEIAAPKVPDDETKVLGATSVFISQDYQKAYVAYNLAGPDRYGAIDIVDISKLKQPKLVQSVLYKDIDINSVFVYKYGTGAFMYIAGSMAKDRLADLANLTADDFEAKNATLERVTLTSEGLFATNKDDGSINTAKLYSKLTNLPGYQTTSVFQTYSPAGRYVFATAGDDPTGGTLVFDYTNFPKIIDQDTYDNAKYLDVEINKALTGYNSKQITLQGGRKAPGTLHIYTVGKSDANAHKTIDLGEVDTEETQNAVDLYQNIAYLALGAGGMKAFDITKAPDNTPKYQMTKADPENEVVCNGVASDNSMVYMAMGAGGLWVAPLESADGDGNLPPFEASNFGASANFVAYDPNSGLIFVAGGTQGLKIISGGISENAY